MDSSVSSPLDARTLQLDLFLDAARIPWGGRSPRALTKAAQLLFSKHGGEKSMSDFVDGDQIEIWPTDKNGPPSSFGGSPLLLPF